jgi:hypothetical protein
MKEMTSNHDDMDKRLAIFFGVGAFLLSSLVGLIRGYSFEGFLLQGVVVLTLAILAAYGFAYWLRQALASTKPEEELPEGMERRSHNKETLEEGSLVIPNQGVEAVVAEDAAAPGSAVNYTFAELSPSAAAATAPAPAPAPAAAAAAAAVADSGDDSDLPPPPVPSWLK